MIPVHWSPLANHLWQSTLFAGVAAILALVLRKNRAQTRYLLWLSASVKFLVPFSLLVGVGSQFEWRNAVAVWPRCRWRWQWNKSASPLLHRVTRLLRLLGFRWLRR